MTSNSLKILVVGDVNGSFKKLFDRVINVNRKSGPFDLLLCCGNFFANDENLNTEWEEVTHGNISLPSIPVYILGPTTDNQVKYYKNSNIGNADFDSGFDLIDGITFLGRKGVLTGSSGIKIAYLSGFEGSEAEASPGCNFSTEDFESLLLQRQSSTSIIDILLTNQWPKHVLKFTESPSKELESLEQQGSELISQLTYIIKPRYIFCSGGNHYFERPPFRNHQVLAESARQVTRLLSIASVTNNTKAKWLYAFTIKPAISIDRSELVKQPTDVTENPFHGVVKRRFQITHKREEKPPQFFYDMNSSSGHDQRQGRKRPQDRDYAEKNKNSRPPPQPKEPCWFCLASPEVEKHLIISIGEHCYLALAKGGLVDDHMLILPIGHYRSTVEIADNTEVNEEIKRFKTSLINYYITKNKYPIFFERNYKTSHLQVQVVPVPKDKANSITDVISEYEEMGMKFNELPENCGLHEMINPGVPYFYIEFPQKNLFTCIKGGRNFPLQLGRELLANEEILNCPEKVDWKACILSKEVSKEVVNKIRSDYQPFDFTV